jgi:hypothetical protein
MRRALALFSLVLAVLAVAAATAGAARPRHELGFELHADGFSVTGRSPLGGERVRLTLDRHGEVAYYWARAEIGADSVRVRFGRLGALAFHFTPDKDEGPLGCAGHYYGAQRGTFRGTLVFHGEHRYADIHATRARGYMESRPHPSQCGNGSRSSRGEGEVRRATTRAEAGLAARPTARRDGAGSERPFLTITPPIAETGAVLEATTANALPANVFYSFLDHGPHGLRVVLGGLREEKREGMRIERGVQIYGGNAGFQWNLGTGTALLEPPAPFEGRAVYKREGHGKASWTGSLRIPVLGAPRPLRLTGSAFTAHLRADT